LRVGPSTFCHHEEANGGHARSRESERRPRGDDGDGKKKPAPPNGVREQKGLPVEERTHELP